MRCPSFRLMRAVFILGGVTTACKLFMCSPALHADDKKVEAVRVTGTEPTVIVSGSKSTLKLRGFQLKEATEVKMAAAPELKFEITEKKEAGQPKGLENKLVGDSQLVANITLPAEQPPGMLEFTVTTPVGIATGKIRVLSKESVVDEAEPNNGFREAQRLQTGQSARGSIQGDKDVDVFAYPMISGKQYKVTVMSGAPSILDAELVSYNAGGQLIAATDDAQTRDPVLILQAPVRANAAEPDAQVVYLCVSSAHDLGGEWHSYWLTVEEVK